MGGRFVLEACIEVLKIVVTVHTFRVVGGMEATSTAKMDIAFVPGETLFRAKVMTENY